MYAHACTGVCRRTQGYSRGDSVRGSQQGLFWNHLSKSPTGAVGTGSSPLGEPGHPLGHFSPVASASVLKHCGPARWLCQQDRAFTLRGRPLSRHPAWECRLCAKARWQGAVGSVPSLAPELGWGHSPFTQAPESSASDRSSCGPFRPHPPTGLQSP